MYSYGESKLNVYDCVSEQLNECVSYYTMMYVCKHVGL